MNHLKKFYESKTPIDVEMDVIEFREKFAERLSKYFDAWPSLDTILSRLVRENPTMTDDYKFYQVWNSNMKNYPDKDTKVIKAVSPWHAKIIEANRNTIINIRVITEVNWRVIEIDQNTIDGYIADLEARIEGARRKIERLREL